ncbi:MAG: ABC-2 transporter permease [Holophagaceae bacterium]|nr:ABC-2 transporter permease [Holophagaceae bacterium]
MLLELLKRDLRLHRLFLLTPLFIALVAGIGGAERQSDVAGFFIGIAIIASCFLPLSFHLRELSEGTLPALLALPLPRERVVALRYLEAALLPVVAVLLLALSGQVSATLRGNTQTPLILVGLVHHPLALAWSFFLWFAYPLPAVLRWGGKGLTVAYGVPGLGVFTLLFLAPRLHSESWASRAVLGLLKGILWLDSHPGPTFAGLAVATVLAFLLARRAFAAREF